MPLHVFRAFHGSFQVVGSFSGDAHSHNRLFCYSDAYLESNNAAAISHSLPLRAASYTVDDYQGFFDGLVPEGPMRAELSRMFQVPYSDYLGLLEHFGNECIGALQFSSCDLPEERMYFEAYGEKELREMADRPARLSVEMVSASRLSLAGAQTKFGVYIDPVTGNMQDASTWYKPLQSAPSTHIVKVADDRFSKLPYNELACMVLAEKCGLPVAQVCVPQYFSSLLVVQRFDRLFADDMQVVDGHPVPLRLHQEDICQALGWAPYMKYENFDLLYAQLVGRVITQTSSDAIADRELFAYHMLFDYMVGNCDGHLKNYSMLYDPDWEGRRLAPLYDIVSTTLLGFDRKMGMSIGEHIVIDEITSDDWFLFAKDIHLPARSLSRLAQEMVQVLSQAVEEAMSVLPRQGQEQLERIINDAQQRIHVLKEVGQR